ncbi:MAG: tail fiber protein [Kiritimatiellae bacterium]|nr:tail fiber protein [Kiritimatiellia bacterium]
MKKQMKMAWVATMAVAWAWMGWAAPAPQVIPFQGRLTDQAGTPYSEGTYTIVFNLYDAPVGGTALWTERHTGVGLVNGMVNVFLGSIVALDGQDFTQTRYLGITIDADGNANTADPEMVPRQMIVPAFFAKDSESLRGADWSAILASGATDPRTGYIAGARIASKSVKAAQIADKNVTTAKLADKSVTSAKIADGAIEPDHLSAAMKNDLASAFLPPGIIMPFAGPAENVPVGWLLCDGRAVASTTYPKLFANIGTTWGYETNITENGVTYFKLPDLRNRTLWGAGEHKVGKYVEAGLPNITGTVGGIGHLGVVNGVFAIPSSNGYGGGTGGSHNANFDASRSSPIYGRSDTVQPPSGAVNFIIKVDPTY